MRALALRQKLEKKLTQIDKMLTQSTTSVGPSGGPIALPSVDRNGGDATSWMNDIVALANELKEISRHLESSGMQSQAVLPQTNFQFVPPNFNDSLLATFRSEKLEESFEKFGYGQETQRSLLKEIKALLPAP